MTNAQTIIDQLLSGYVHQYVISEEAQSVIERVRQRVVSSPDPKKDVETLYGAKDCDEMALGLMWVLERAASDMTRTTATPEEEQAVHTGLTATLTHMGMLNEPSAEQDTVSTEEPEVVAAETGETSFGTIPDTVQDDAVESSADMIQEPAVETMGDAEGPADEAGEDFGSAPMPEPAGAEEETEVEAEPAPTAIAGEGTTDPGVIGSQLEQLLEALQAGADERDPLLASLRASFAACLADSSIDPALHRYSEVVDDFLGYVQDNDLLDDVRVMNFFTNVQEPYAQWLEAPEGEREGILEQAIDFLADFRAMFE